MKIFLTIFLINIFFIYAKENLKNKTISDSILKEDLIGNIIEDLDKIISDIFENIEEMEVDMNDDLLENEIIIGDNLGDFNFEPDEEIIEKKISGLDDTDEDEYIWPERPIPRYQNIV